MTRENVRKTKHKHPRFKDTHDEDLNWQDRKEIQNLRRKENKRSQKHRNGSEKW